MSNITSIILAFTTLSTAIAVQAAELPAYVYGGNQVWHQSASVPAPLEVRVPTPALRYVGEPARVGGAEATAPSAFVFSGADIAARARAYVG